ncbi:ead/Ea22-like family protein [Escherichia coli]|nr:ead/Ea22-like family protein [Escherichia coli]
MSEINSQALREAAEQAMHDDWGFDADLFHELVTPSIVLELLDERERNQQYIKRRDQENEDIALTVGKLRVELEAAKNNLIDSECHVTELEEALRDKQALLETSEKRIAILETIKSAAEKLVRCKGRYHSEQNYRALAALFGVTVPDLLPLENNK